MKTQAIVLLFLLSILSNLPAAPDVEGDRLDVGWKNGLNAVLGTIAGGSLNTNASAFSVISGGQANTILGASDDGWCAIGGGIKNVIDGGTSCVIAGGSNNRIEDGSYDSSICGGLGNVILDNSAYSWVGGGSGNMIGTNSAFGTIAGGNSHIIDRNAGYSTISGGGGNRIYASKGLNVFNTIGGGSGNVIGTNCVQSTIPGGGGNFIAGTNQASLIAGGAVNLIQPHCDGATIGGGWENGISFGAAYATIAGGFQNAIRTGAYGATIAGGVGNQAYGKYSLAAGLNAGATYDGCFVWGDSSSPVNTVYSTAPNQFVVRATGGIWFGRGDDVQIPSGHFLETTTGGYLSTGGAWVNNSDRNRKQNFAPVDSRQILAKVIALPLSSWNYKAEDDAVRHLGPMAQDFYGAFRLGPDARHITSLDETGVALAAIQGLYQEKQAQVAALEEEMAALRKQMEVQKQTLDRWEARFAVAGTAPAKPEQKPDEALAAASREDGP
ncbi:MAG TPA: tail fiber domain-containing protein [Candidatus Binatia bacterium]|jgi:hypothetical protein|nr:tail fiber domain-containing protein [Candidatus Binatia bacterium]